MKKIFIIMSIMICTASAVFADKWSTGIRYGSSMVGAIGFTLESPAIETTYQPGDLFKVGVSCRFSDNSSWTNGVLQLEGSVCAPLAWYRPEIGLGIYLFGASAKSDSSPLPDFIAQYGIYATLKPFRFNLSNMAGVNLEIRNKKFETEISLAELRYGPLVPFRFTEPSVPDYSGDFMFLEFSPVCISLGF